MKQLFLTALLLPLLLNAASLPRGTYLDTCSYCEVDSSDTLHCECKDAGDGHHETHLANASGCEKIENVHGKLAGSKTLANFLIANPSIIKDCHVTCDDALVCESLNVRVTQISRYEYCRVYEDGSKLALFLKGMPLGSYRESCVDCAMDAEKTLSCKCLERGIYIDTQLANADSFSWVKNRAGHLLGYKKQSDLPKGSYSQTCIDCRFDLNRALNCRCKSGSLFFPSRLLVEGEYSDISNERGKLSLVPLSVVQTVTNWFFRGLDSIFQSEPSGVKPNL